MPARKKAKSGKFETHLIQVVLIGATVLLAIGIFAPLITVKKMVLWQNTLSIVSGLQALWLDDQYILFLIIALFSLVMPLAKIAILFRVVFKPPRKSAATKRLISLMHDIGRWAMLDVLVVALLLVTLKLGALATVEIHNGLYLFTAAVLLIALITHWVASRPPSRAR